MQNEKLRVYLEGTLFAAIAMILSMIPTGIGSSYSISLGTIPLTFFAIRRGMLPGLFSGFLRGILHVVSWNSLYIKYISIFLLNIPLHLPLLDLLDIIARKLVIV